MQEIEITQLRTLTELIKTRFNYDFGNYAMSSFKRRIQRILELYKFSSFDALLEKINTCDKKYFQDFISEITVNVTEMFRDPSFWVELRENILPNLLMDNQTISIWHAGCSSGEEVYSMAITLKELDCLEKVRIVATDVDMAILQKAREGAYSIKNMELNAKNYERAKGAFSIDKYYKEQNGKAMMDKSLVKDVIYREHNLVSEVSFGKFDLILCRNVMIYFNQALQNQVLKVFHESLFKNSYLIVGSKESLIWCEIANKFTVVNNEEKVYKKTKE
ncbi:MAG: protein-glutamate O-methyltransferase CheR [Cytophagia bacterium]|nr:MAG: protein-glutamate O-methyltransferase CheR [Cytophagales bacterium]TAG05714.1 MAG: protein-glutamate O-methyltransferase CheR [Cytophagia bacterium]TAG43699.1 MAG: protein-glutamate O-methyltransferase CheR [Cytophagia bacterium]TAH30121.1 MAG: protein-glutamate O-methyltransferase CheR [Cytophagales bacterium]